MRIALVGAPATGKTTLARELAGALRGRAGIVIEDSPAPDRCRAFDSTLLMGLDLPGAGHEAEDARLRQSLQQAGVAWQVVYGSGPNRLRAALAALGAAPREEAPVRWTWNCERCGDADCEHRLFKL
ncbi:MAG TPA: ATP-binding protein [Ramlibacter sp.]|nr:ATP-binding protein [Ramlibacter sp.]